MSFSDARLAARCFGSLIDVCGEMYSAVFFLSTGEQLRRALADAIEEADALRFEVCDGVPDKMLQVVRMHAKMGGRRFDAPDEVVKGTDAVVVGSGLFYHGCVLLFGSL